jgi:hypothetical protein
MPQDSTWQNEQCARGDLVATGKGRAALKRQAGKLELSASRDVAVTEVLMALQLTHQSKGCQRRMAVTTPDARTVDV